MPASVLSFSHIFMFHKDQAQKVLDFYEVIRGKYCHLALELNLQFRAAKVGLIALLVSRVRWIRM